MSGEDGTGKDQPEKVNEDNVEENEEEEEDEAVDIQNLRVVDLRFALRLRGLPTGGKKAELIDRLEAAIKAEATSAQEETVEEKKEEPPQPNLEDLEKKINEGKAQKNRKEEQLKKIKQLLEDQEKNLSKLTKEKKKLLGPSSPANTEDFKAKLHADIEKRKVKKNLFNDEEDDAPSDEDKYSQSWSIFGATPLGKIENKLEKALTFGEKAKQRATDKEVLKSARQRCIDAQNYAEANADKCENVTIEEKESVEDTIADLDDMIFSLDILLSNIDKVRAERSSAIKPSAPTWDPQHPSGFLSFHESFKEARGRRG